MTGLNAPDSISSLTSLTVAWLRLRTGKHDPLAAKERGDERQRQVLPQRARVRREVQPARLQQPPASPERTLADGIEHHVVPLIVLREVLGRIVDDPVGAQAADQPQVRRGADRGHVCVEALQKLDRR